MRGVVVRLHTPPGQLARASRSLGEALSRRSVLSARSPGGARAHDSLGRRSGSAPGGDEHAHVRHAGRVRSVGGDGRTGAGTVRCGDAATAQGSSRQEQCACPEGRGQGRLAGRSRVAPPSSGGRSEDRRVSRAVCRRVAVGRGVACDVRSVHSGRGRRTGHGAARGAEAASPARDQRLAPTYTDRHSICPEVGPVTLRPLRGRAAQTYQSPPDAHVWYSSAPTPACCAHWHRVEGDEELSI